MTFSLFRTQHFIEFAYFYLKNMNTIELRDDIDFQLPSEYFYWTSFNKININSLFYGYFFKFTFQCNSSRFKSKAYKYFYRI